MPDLTKRPELYRTRGNGRIGRAPAALAARTSQLQDVSSNARTGLGKTAACGDGSGRQGRNGNVSRVIASLHRDGTCLELKTVDLCFLVALYTRAESSGLTCFDEEVLLDVFEQVCDSVEAGAENPRKRATHAVQRLREQKLLSRVDGAGLVRAGEYSLTRLSQGIVEFFLDDDVLTRESLTLLTKTLLANLADVKASARKARTEEEWRARVIAPLRVTVGDLVAGIERRQRGLDVQQEDLQKSVSELLHADWFDAVERCQSLLDETTSTLAELNEILLHDSSQMQALLHDIEQLAADCGAPKAEGAAQRVAEQVDRVTAWGGTRQRAWSEYYQYVHRFLRDVVRLDPDRALSDRLRTQLTNWPRHPFALIAANAPSIRLLRECEARVERPPVVRPKRNRESPLDEVPPDQELRNLEDRVRQALAQEPPNLSGVLRELLPDVDPRRRFLVIGRIAAQVAAEAKPRSARERPWVSLQDEIEVEDWTLPRRNKE